MANSLFVFLIIFFALFTQSIVGFGSALIAMALLPAVVGLKTAAPLFALLAVVFESILLIYYRKAFQLRSVVIILIGAVFGIPIGLFALVKVDEREILPFLGGFMLVYAAFGLAEFKIPQIRHSFWGIFAGFLSGILGGAYNTTGPPVIVYGSSRGWSPSEFKANLQGYFLLSGIFIFAGHAIAGNYQLEVWRQIWISIPAAGLGFLAGTWVERRIQSETFQKLVFLLLAVLGFNLLRT